MVTTPLLLLLVDGGYLRVELVQGAGLGAGKISRPAVGLLVRRGVLFIEGAL